MANGAPGVGQTYGGAASMAEIQQFTGTNGQFGPPIGNDGLVYLGPSYRKPARTPGMGEYVGSTVGYQDISSAMVSVDAAKARWWSMDEEEREDWFDVSSQLNGYDVRKNPKTAWYDWNTMVDQAGAYQKATGEPMTPREMAMTIAQWTKPKGEGGGSGGVSTVVNLTNPDDARVFVDNALKTYLGRAATEEESETFLSTLNKVERKNPIVSTPSSRSGGTNPQLVAQEFARSREDAAEFLASTQYTDWMMEAVRSDTTEGLASGL